MGQGGRGCRYKAGVSLSRWSTLDYLSLLGERWIPVPLPPPVPARTSFLCPRDAGEFGPVAGLFLAMTFGLVEGAGWPLRSPIGRFSPDLWTIGRH